MTGWVVVVVVVVEGPALVDDRWASLLAKVEADDEDRVPCEGKSDPNRWAVSIKREGTDRG